MFTLDRVVPWGRSFDEYRAMFALSDGDLEVKLLDCAGGPSGFTAEASRRGSAVISCDPIYQYEAGQIQSRIAATCDQILDQTRRNTDQFVWTHIQSVEELGALRLSAMRSFLDDYPSGRVAGRYVTAELPRLPFADRAFGLALSSHFLFLYSEQLDLAFHLAAMLEMCRVAAEVRVFPLLALGGTPSPHLQPIAGDLRQRGLDVSIDTVPYEFQRGGNQMLRVRRQCPALAGPLSSPRTHLC
jgi:hypothetical protein